MRGSPSRAATGYRTIAAKLCAGPAMPLFVDNGEVLVDLPGVVDVPISSLGRVEFIGDGQACLVFYRSVLAPGGSALEHQICARLYAPLAVAPAVAQLLVKAAVEGGLLAAATVSARLLM